METGVVMWVVATVVSRKKVIRIKAMKMKTAMMIDYLIKMTIINQYPYLLTSTAIFKIL